MAEMPAHSGTSTSSTAKRLSLLSVNASMTSSASSRPSARRETAAAISPAGRATSHTSSRATTGTGPRPAPSGASGGTPPATSRVAPRSVPAAPSGSGTVGTAGAWPTVGGPASAGPGGSLVHPRATPPPPDIGVGRAGTLSIRCQPRHGNVAAAPTSPKAWRCPPCGHCRPDVVPPPAPRRRCCRASRSNNPVAPHHRCKRRRPPEVVVFPGCGAGSTAQVSLEFSSPGSRLSDARYAWAGPDSPIRRFAARRLRANANAPGLRCPATRGTFARGQRT